MENTNNYSLIKEYKENGKLKAKLVCNKCNNTKTISRYRYLIGHIGKCNVCFPKYVGDISNIFFSKIKENANRRKLELNIDREYLWELFIKQNKRCAISNLEINFNNDRLKTTASLDRIDSNKGYIKGNIRWLHKVINQIKSDYTDDEFFYICNIVSENDNRPVDNKLNIDNISKINERKSKKSYENLNHGFSKPIIQYDINGNFIKEWESISDACHELGYKQTTGISAVCRKKQKSSGGYIWEFKK